MKPVAFVVGLILTASICLGQTSAPASAPASGPAIATSEVVPTIPWDQAGDFIGKEVFAVGKVVRSSKIKAGHVFLNFDTDRNSKGLVIFIRKESVEKFPGKPEQTYRDRMIKVRGFVIEFKNAPEIAVTSPDQIQLLDDGAALPPPASKPAVRKRFAGNVVTIGSYNLLNLFDDVNDPYTNDEGTPAKPRAELEALARSIRALDADVLAVVEVENRGILQKFVDAFLEDMGYEVVLFEGNDLRGIDVGLLSRVPVGEVISHRHMKFKEASGKPTRFMRDLLQVRLRPENALPFDVFVVHYKSKGGEDNGGAATRLAEAVETRYVIDNMLNERSDARFVICGDYNDTIDSEPLKALISTGPMALTTFIGDLPSNETITFNQPPHLSMIDFILASPAMAKTYVSKSYHVRVGGSPEKTGSDHNPVVAQFKLD